MSDIFKSLLHYLLPGRWRVTLAWLVLALPLSGQRDLAYTPRLDEQVPAWVRAMYRPDPDPGEVMALYEAYYREHPFEKNQHTQYYKRWITDLGKRYVPDAAKDARYLAAYNANQASRSPANWTCIGPFDWDHDAAGRSYAPGSAHVYTVEQAKTQPDILYAGTANAGLWKTTNRGQTWLPLTADLLTGSVVALDIDPTNANVVYAGMMSNLYKSVNGGDDWVPTGDAAFMALNFATRDIRCRPDAPATVFAATSAGLYRTTNGGNDWSLALGGNMLEIEFHPLHPDTMYAVRVNGDITEFFRSLNGGISFTLHTSGWPSPNTGLGEHQERTELAVTPAAPDHVYALATGSANGGSGLYGVYVSADLGATWAFQCCGPQPAGPPSLSNPNLMGWEDNGTDDGGQYYYDLAFEVSPYNPDSMWVCGVNLWVSGNGGASFTCPAKWSHPHKPQYVHADIHDIQYSAHTGELWVANDGGIFYSTDRGANFVRRNNGIAGSDFWGFGMGHWYGDVMIGGAYHNGTLLKEEDTYINGWICTDGGDGTGGFVNPGLDRQAYSNYNIKMLKGDRTIAPETRSFAYKPNSTYITGRSSDLLFHPNHYGTWYSGSGTKLWLTRDNGYTFEEIHDFGADVAAMDLCISQPDVIYAATFAGWWDVKRIYRTLDGGATWTEITPTGATINNSHAWIPYDIAVDPDDPLRLWIVRTSMYSDYPDYDGYKVFTSTDGGATWTNITGTNLDDRYPTCLMHQHGTNGGLYVGTRKSVYYRNADMPDWDLFSTGLPALTHSTKLLPWYRHGKIRNATNRSVWESPFYEPSAPRAIPAVRQAYVFCSRDTARFVDRSILHESGATWSWSFPGGEPATSSLREPEVVYHQPGIYPVTLIVQDPYGADTTTISAMIVADRQCAVDTTPGGALSISGNPGFLQLRDVDQPVSAFTASAWVKPDGIQPNYSAVIMNDGETAGLNFREGNNTLGYHWPGGSWSWDSQLIVPPGEWSHVAMVVQPGSVTLYVNGEYAIHNTGVQPVELTDIKAGSYKGWADRNFRGAMDELCLWSRALSAEEIRLQRHLVKFPEGDPTLFAYYQFDTLPISGVIDKSNQFDGVLSGNAILTVSDAPVGSGTSQLRTVDQTGYIPFDAGGDLGIGFPGASPNGQVVVTHLHVPPSSLPATGTLQGNYWIVNNYGTQEVFPTLDSLVFRDAGSMSHVQAMLPGSTLHTRPANATGVWNAMTVGELSAQSGLAASFRAADITSAGAFGQYVIMRDTLPVAEADVVISAPDMPSTTVPGGGSTALLLHTHYQGIRLPPMTIADIQAAGSPVPGQLAFLTDSLRVAYYNGYRWMLARQEAVLQYSAESPPDTFATFSRTGGPAEASALVMLDSGFVCVPVFAGADIPDIDYPAPGMLIFDATSLSLRVYQGQSWQSLSASGTVITGNPASPEHVPGVAINQSVKYPAAVLDIAATGSKAVRLPHASPGWIYDPVPGLLTYHPETGALMIFTGAYWAILR